jgi:drug/metabolite transporter (DMT)-like permease
MKTGHLTLKIFALIVLNDIGESVAQLVMKKGLAHSGIVSVTLGNIAQFVMENISSPLLWLGILIYTLNFFVWIIVLYKIDLSIAMPVGSTSYLFVPVAAVIFLHEHISPLRWLGIMCIILGIHFVCRSKPPLKEG